MKSSTITGGAGSHERHASDFYETPAECTVALMDFLDLSNNKKILEPACGNGAIVEVLRRYINGENIDAQDIRITGYSVFKEDFLSIENIQSGYYDWIITNPPFNLAEQFIRRALSITPNVAMLLKATYWHTASRSGLFNECNPAYVLPMTWRPSMAPERGSQPTMDFMWVVWSNELDSHYDGETIYKLLSKPTKERMKEVMG